ncbi:MAG TPA: hypothetical protein VK932_07205 [Kofleriaceae bacterium]|nr:hypothetical protein [Kofleriaceae bacterium]
MAVGVWLVLHMLGIGIGLIAIDPDEADSLRAVGIGTGIWSAIAPLIALFIGGLVAGRMAPTINTANAAIHGAVVWALTGVAALLLLATAVSSAVRGAAAAGAAVGQSAAAAVGMAPSDLDLQDFGLASEDVLAPINQRLKAEGIEPVTAAQLEAAAKDVLRVAVRDGRLDREVLVSSLTRNTRMSRAEAERVADRAEQRYAELRARASAAGQKATRTALQAAETTGKVMLVLSILMVLGLGASIAGAIASVRRERREHVVLPRAQTTVRTVSES